MEPRGLTQSEVEERIARGEVNTNADVKTRSVKQIALENICTLFNAINVALALFVLFTGSFKNMLFMLVIVINTAIGIFQEIRSKKTTDALSIVAASHATVIRDGKESSVTLEQIVKDDVLVLGRGDQIPADCVVISGSCDVNESLLTGESALVKKEVDSDLMSGSFVNAGTVKARVIHVGAENYAAQICAEAKQRKEINSEIMTTLNGIIKFVSFIIFPLGALLLGREILLDHVPVNDAILSTVAALVGMIPEGLILLTSTVLALSVIRLAKSKVLVQQLYCIETLARVDVLCLDKTGTITTGAMEVKELDAVEGIDKQEVLHALNLLSSTDEDPNETSQAIQEYCAANPSKASAEAVRVIPFSSDKKWSGASFETGESYVMGAGQFVMGEAFAPLENQAGELAKNARVILVARVEGFTEDGNIVGCPTALGFVCIHDQIRQTAAQTIGYFKEQGVTVNVISGDDPRTVSGIAAQVGVEGAEAYVDATTLKTDSDIEDAMTKYHVFGRVKPEQKKAFVKALQKNGHVVAMTGDGVNDTLALKASDCSIAMASGSDAARNVAQLVLVNNDFASMPKVVAEGRRSINNLQRSASLFLVKTLLSISLAVLFIFFPWQYPFQPIQMTLISAFTIGLPSFVLALEPNKDRITGRFLENVIVKSIPSAVTAVATIAAVNVIGYNALGLDYSQVSTLCVLLTAFIGFLLIARISFPFTPLRIGLLIVVVAGTVLGAVLMPHLFGIAPFNADMWFVFGVCVAATTVVFQLLYTAMDKWHASYLAKEAAKVK